LCFKDENGEWLSAAADAAMIFPLLEMAGFYRVHFNEKVLYIYNIGNPDSHHKIELKHEQNSFEIVRSRRPFALVNSYLPVFEKPNIPY
jgi:hypothetical protein